MSLRPEFWLLSLAAALMPLLSPVLASRLNPAEQQTIAAGPQADFPGWPVQLDGKPLREIPLSETEAGFQAGFPGRVGKFEAQGEVVILRWISQETRRLHPAADCYKGLGYTASAQTVSKDASGSWGRTLVSKGDQHLQVQEQLRDSAGQSWSDVSAWYWAAFLGQTQGPWWSVTRVAIAPEAGL